MQGAGAEIAATRKKGPPFWPSLAILIVGIVVTVAAIVWLLVGVLPPVAGTRVQMPGAWKVDLERGPQVVYERIDDERARAATRLEGVTIDQGQVTVAAPDGRPIAVHNASPDDSTDRDDDHYVAAVRFDAERSGEHTIRFRTAEGEVIVAQPLGEAIQRHVPSVIAVVVGWLIALAGIAMLLTGVIRRGRDARRSRPLVLGARAPGHGMPSPGWYADPKGDDRLRWWDGSYWTDQTRS